MWRDEAGFSRVLANLPWPALPFKNKARMRSSSSSGPASLRLRHGCIRVGCVLLSACVTVGNDWLKQQFSVSSIPALVVLDRDGRAQRVPARRSRPVQCTHEQICTMQPHWAAALNAMPATVLGNHDDSHTLLCGCADERRHESAARRSDRSSLPVGRNVGHDSGARTEVGALHGANDC